MRLTLRTLLAWLDHVLPPEDQKELGDKVAASAAAQQLVDRIRRVVERPGISAPRVDGKGLAADANSVAEYLTNTLPSEQLESFERICVESDMHLAEVAACHHLLATAEADPSVFEPLDAERRRRLLTAMQHHSAALFSELERREATANAHAVKAALAKSADEEDTVLITQPTAARPRLEVGEPPRSSRGAWAAAAAALALLLMLGGMLWFSINAGRGRKVAVRPEAEPAAVEEQAEALPQAEPLPPAEAPIQATKTETAESIAPPPPAAPAEPPPAIAAPAPPVEPATDAAPVAAMPAPPPPTVPFGPTPPPAPPAQPRVPFGDALAIAAPAPPVPVQPPVQPSVQPSVQPPAMPAMQPPVTPTPTVDPAEASPFDAPTATPPEPRPPEEAVGAVGTDGVLLHRVVEAGQTSWAFFPANAGLAAQEDLLAPAGFHPDVTIRGVRIRLMPGTRATVSLDPDGTPRIAVAFGRVVARASQADARLAVTADGLSGTITAGLTEPVGISVELERFAGSDPAVEPARVRAGIVPASGGIVWRQAAGSNAMLAGIAAEGMLESRMTVIWDSLRPDAATVERLPTLPDWIAVGTPQPSRLEKSAAEALAAKVAAVAPLDRALRELAADRRVENRLLAVTTLALLGEYDDLVELLSADASGRRLEGRQWLMLEGDTVPLALSRGERSAGRLAEAFEDRGPHGKGEALYRMARGFTNEELAAGADEMLVAALDDEDLVVRRYAIKCLCDIVQPSATDRLRYRPDGLADLRREGVNWWRAQLEKGLVRRTAARPAAPAEAP